MEACSLLFSTIWLFAYSVQLNERISRVISSNGTVNLCATTNSARNRGSVQNIVYVLFICSCTYLARVFCLTLLGIDIISGSNRTDRFTNVGWFVISNWIPTLIPVQNLRLLFVQFYSSFMILCAVYRGYYSCIPVELLALKLS